jgi:uncharacterized membrane protein
MIEAVAVLFLSALMFIVSIVLIVLLYGRVAELSRRLGQLEQQSRGRPGAEAAARPVALPAAPGPEPVVLELAEEPEALPPAVRAEPRTATPSARPTASWPVEGFAQVEAWIGRRGLGWTAVALLIFATAFFLKYAFENRWVGEVGRVAIGVAFGSALCLAGYRYHRQGWRIFSQMLSAGGVVLLYLSTYAAFGFYHLLPREWAAGFLVGVIAETATLALLYKAPAIALMAVIGGLLTPLLLRTDRDQYLALFSYLSVLNAGVIGLLLLRRWRGVGSVALVGTQLLFWIWWGQRYHPEKLAAALAFQAVLFLLYLGLSVLRSARVPLPAARGARRADIEELGRLVVHAFLFGLAGYVLLRPDHERWLGSLAVGMATIYTAVGWFLFRRNPDDPRLVVVMVAIALAFVAAVFPLEAEALWIPVGWAVEGLALCWFGLRLRALPLRVFGLVLLVLAVGRLLLDPMPYTRAPFVPIVNKYALPALAVAACVLLVPLAGRRLDRARLDFDRLVMWLCGLGGVLLVWFVLSVETYTYFSTQIDDQALSAMQMRAGPERAMQLWEQHQEKVRSLRQWGLMALSALWAVYAAVILVLGFRLPNRPLRWLALAIFALTLFKVVLVDMAGLPGLYRVAAFFILSLMMGAAAWAYQKVRLALLPAERPEVEHEPV